MRNRQKMARMLKTILEIFETGAKFQQPMPGRHDLDPLRGLDAVRRIGLGHQEGRPASGNSLPASMRARTSRSKVAGEEMSAATWINWRRPSKSVARKSTSYPSAVAQIDPSDPDPYNIYNALDWQLLVELAEDLGDAAVRWIDSGFCFILIDRSPDAR
jgi:hypothetical protein